MPYNFAADSFHTKKLCSRLSSSEVQFFTEMGLFVFLRPPLGDLGAMYDDHLRLIGKCIVDFLLVLIELFSLGVMAEELRATSSQKTRTTALSYGIKIWTDLSTVLSQFTRVTDGQTDGWTNRQNSHR